MATPAAAPAPAAAGASPAAPAGRRRAWTPEEREAQRREVERLRGAGVSTKAIAKTLQLSPRSIRRHLVHAGLPVGQQPAHLVRPAQQPPAQQPRPRPFPIPIPPIESWELGKAPAAPASAPPAAPASAPPVAPAAPAALVLVIGGADDRLPEALTLSPAERDRVEAHVHRAGVWGGLAAQALRATTEALHEAQERARRAEEALGVVRAEKTRVEASTAELGRLQGQVVGLQTDLTVRAKRHALDLAAAKAGAARQAKALEAEVAVHKARADELGERAVAMARREALALQRLGEAERRATSLLDQANRHGVDAVNGHRLDAELALAPGHGAR